jgi:ABC-type amino acid transport substrate-binding protein
LRRGYLLALLLGISVQGYLSAEEPKLRLVGSITPGVFELKSGEPYTQLYFDVTQDAPLVPELTMLPPMRSNRFFFAGNADCTFMGTDEPEFYQSFNVARDNFLLSKPFNTIRLKAYNSKKDATIKSWEELSGVRIAADSGIEQSSTVQRVLPFANKILYTMSLKQAFDLLKLGRVEAVVAYSIDIDFYKSQSGADFFHASARFDLFSTGETFTCWPSQKADHFIAHVNKRIQELSESKTLQSQYGFKP